MVLMYDTVESGRMQGIMSCVFGRVLQPIVLQICLAFSFLSSGYPAVATGLDAKGFG